MLKPFVPEEKEVAMQNSEQLRQLKQLSIRIYLANMGINPVKEKEGYGMYLSPFRKEQTASFKVDWSSNLWYDFGIGEGGSIIDLVARMKSCTIVEAIRLLEKEQLLNATSLPTNSQPQVSTKKSHIEILSAKELSHLSLVNYLRNRRIGLTIAQSYIREIRYRIAGKDYFAIGFKNDAGGWELRNQYFKGSSTSKNITTIRKDSNTTMVFEGFFDFLSYLSLKDMANPATSTVVLNSTANLDKAIPFLQPHKVVHAFFDNDEAGRKAVEKLEHLLPNSEVIDQSVFYKSCNDLNEYLCNKSNTKKQTEKPRHKIKR